MPANGPECAELAEPDADTTNNVMTAKISRRMTAGISAIGAGLLPRRFPSTATRYARRCPIPLPRSGVAAELTVGICRTNRDSDKSFPANAAGDVGAGSGNFTVRHRKRRALRRFAGTGLGNNRDIPEPIIGCLGGCGCCYKRGGGAESGNDKNGADAVVAHESDPRCV